VIVERVSEESAEVLRYLESVRIFPGAELTIAKVAPFEGPLLVQIHDESLPLSREIAAKVWARPG
jgi:Fe2+ transport system protein FeoA